LDSGLCPSADDFAVHFPDCPDLVSAGEPEQTAVESDCLANGAFLAVTRKIVPPIGGVDITPIIWVGICSLLREMILGQQGLLTMIM
jgi:YGGT family